MNTQIGQANRVRTCHSCRRQVSVSEERCPHCNAILAGVAGGIDVPEVTISWGGAFKIATAILVLPVLVGLVLLLLFAGAGAFAVLS